MANSVSGYHNYNTYPNQGVQSYTSSSLGNLGSNTAYTQYDLNSGTLAAKANYNNPMMSYSTPTPQYPTSSPYYSSQTSSALSYNQTAAPGIYNNYSPSAQTPAAQQLAAAVSLRGFQSPPYGQTGATGYSSSASSHQPTYDQNAALQYKQSAALQYDAQQVLVQHAAQQAAAQHQAAQQAVAQHQAAQQAAAQQQVAQQQAQAVLQIQHVAAVQQHAAAAVAAATSQQTAQQMVAAQQTAQQMVAAQQTAQQMVAAQQNAAQQQLVAAQQSAQQMVTAQQMVAAQQSAQQMAAVQQSAQQMVAAQQSAHQMQMVTAQQNGQQAFQIQPQIQQPAQIQQPPTQAPISQKKDLLMDSYPSNRYQQKNTILHSSNTPNISSKSLGRVASSSTSSSRSTSSNYPPSIGIGGSKSKSNIPSVLQRVHSDMSPGTSFKKNIIPSYKPPFQKTFHPPNHFCEVCKVSCASNKTFKDHFDGKRHKKRLAQLESSKTEEPPPSGALYKCLLCDVNCTGSETFEAHTKGTKHRKATKLYKDLGKEIPRPEIIGNVEPKEEVPIVGEELIETKSDPSKPSKLIHYCKMCECSFNDEFAKTLHLKGRRHRLNYKKSYDPTIKVEIQPSKREKMAEQRAKRRAEELERRRIAMEARRPVWDGGRWRLEEEGNEWTDAHTWHQYKALKAQKEKEYEEACAAEREKAKKLGKPEPTLPPKPHVPPPPPRPNFARFISPSQDEFLMMQKQNMVSPTEESLKHLTDLVEEAEKTLRQVSEEETEGSGRLISTVHRTGSFVKSITLQEDLVAEIVLLCNPKPTQVTLTTIYNKFKELFKCTEGMDLRIEPEKAMFVVKNREATLKIKVTSSAFEKSQTEDERQLEIKEKVLERVYCLSAMCDVNEAGWFKINMKHNKPLIIVLRILTSLRNESEHPLRHLTVRALQCLLFFTFRTFGLIKNVAPTLILRRFLEVLSAGHILKSELIPEWKQVSSVPPNLLQKLDPEQREELTCYAQTALRNLAFGDLHKVLLVPPPPPTQQKLHPIL